MTAINRLNEIKLTQERLKEVLAYDVDSGKFTWKIAISRSIKVGSTAGARGNGGYTQIKIDGIMYKAHRLAWLYKLGKFPEYTIDHVNGISDDNRLCNLRDVIHQENQKNRSLQSNNKSGTPGVRWYKRLNKWEANITIDSKFKYLGCFIDREEAIKARKEAEINHGFHSNHGKVLVKGESR